MTVAGALGLRSPLAKFSVYDAIVQHGFGEDSDSLGGIVQAATSSAHGTPDQVGEEKWLMAFLTTRKEVLLNARDPTTRAGWRASIGRVDEQLRLLKEGNLQLSSPLKLNPYGTEFTVKCANRSSAPTSAPKKDSGRGPHFSGRNHHQCHQAAGAKLFSVRLPTHSGRLPDIWTGNKTHGNNVNQAPIAPPHFLVVGQSRDDMLTAVLAGSNHPDSQFIFNITSRVLQPMP